MNLTELGQAIRDLAAALSAGDWKNVFSLTGTIIAETGGIFKDAGRDPDGWPTMPDAAPGKAAAPKGHADLDAALAELHKAAAPRLKPRALPPAGAAVAGPPGAASALDPGVVGLVLDLVTRLVALWKSWGGA